MEGRSTIRLPGRFRTPAGTRRSGRVMRLVRALLTLLVVALPTVALISDTPAERTSFAPEPATVPVAWTGGMPSPDASFRAGSCASGVCLPRDVVRWANVPFTPDIPCGVGTCHLVMDVYAPATPGVWPVVVVLPGGPDAPTHVRYLGDLAVPLASRGFVVMASGWRMRTSDGGGFPQSFADVACAIGVARRTAGRYGGAPDRVTLAGHSLGAWPAEVAALSDGAVAPATGTCAPVEGRLAPDALVVIDGAPFREFDRRLGRDYLAGMLGGDRSIRPDAWGAVDPYVLMAAHRTGTPEPPILVVHGADDRLIRPSVAGALQSDLAAAGRSSRLVIVPGADHSSVLGAFDTVDAIAAFAARP